MDIQQNTTTTTTTSTDTGLLSRLLVELNIARRNFRSYPKDHPTISVSFNKVIDIYDRLLSQEGSIVIGVARDSLMVNDAVLDKNNLVFRDFAKVLFEHGIGALILRSGLSMEELRNFNIILCLKREEVLNHGGISAVWEKSNISTLEIKAIRYDLFNVTENSSVASEKAEQTTLGLWERFARGLVRDTLIADGLEDGEIDPRVLASILNRQMGASDLGNDSGFTDSAISSFIELTLDTPRNEAMSSVP